MKITIEDVRRVAALAHLDIDASQSATLRANLSQMLDYVVLLNEVDTSSVSPACGAIENLSGLRADQECPCLDQDGALANAPESAQGHFKTPRAIPG